MVKEGGWKKTITALTFIVLGLFAVITATILIGADILGDVFRYLLPWGLVLLGIFSAIGFTVALKDRKR